MTLRSLCSSLLAGAAALFLLYLGLVVAAEASRDEARIILPDRVVLLAEAALLLLVLGNFLAVALRRGWSRLVPLCVLLILLPVLFLVLSFTEIAVRRREVDRLTLPDGRVVMMTYGPGWTDTVVDLWWRHGWRWRPVFRSASDISYSEYHDFTENPALVLTPDRQRLLIRRGGIWTDCWMVAQALKACLPDEGSIPDGNRAAWLARSDRIAAAAGVEALQPPPAPDF